MNIKEKIVLKVLLGVISWLGKDMQGFYFATEFNEIKDLIKREKV